MRASLPVLSVLTVVACGDVRADLDPLGKPPSDAGAASSSGGAAAANPSAGAPGGAGGSTGHGGSAAREPLPDAGVECRDSTDCIAMCTTFDCDRDLCDPVRGRCVECVQDGHCDDPGEICSVSLGQCAAPCDSDTDCLADEGLCDPVVGVCVECRTDADCDALESERCRGSECISAAESFP